MGTLYNSNADIVYRIINTLGWIAGIACVTMVLVSLVKIMTGDEGDNSRYTKRIKNGIIALILILCITQVTSLVTTYFSTESLDYKTGIGDFTSVASSANGDITADVEDIEGREVYVIDGTLYVVTASEKNYSLDNRLVWNVTPYCL